MVIRILQSEDRFPQMTVTEAEDGEDVVQMVREKMDTGEKFDFILMDNIMVRYIVAFDIPYLWSDQDIIHLSKLKMHGPQVASILRKEFDFRGVIIGIVKISWTTTLFSLAPCICRYHGQRPSRPDSRFHPARGQSRAVQALHEGEALWGDYGVHVLSA